MAFATAGSATLAGILAAIVSLLVANRMIQSAEDQHLRGGALAFLQELPLSRSTNDELRKAADDEQRELEPARIRIAVRRDGDFVAGDATLGWVRPGTCATTDRGGITLRTCAEERQGVLVAASGIHLSYGLGTATLACLASALVAVLCALGASRRSARWALEPLTRLRRSLETVTVDDPTRTRISGDETCTEVADVRAAVEALLGRLSEALDAARNYSAEAAHELKTPLTAVRAELDLLAEESLGEREREAVERLRTRVATVSHLVDRLLLLATVSVSPQSMRDAVALEDLVRDLVARLEEGSRDRIAFTTDGAGMARGDEMLLASLVENVIDNALKFSSGIVSVHVREAAKVVLEVRDHGPGVPENARKRAFDAFFRTPEARGANTRGHGVGLALVARIAAAHRGTAVFVDPPDGKGGACFRLTLPRWEEEANS